VTAHRARHAVAILSVLCVCLLSRWAAAFNLPPCGGHVTDTGNLLTAQTKKDIDAKLDKLAHDTLVDAPGWVVDVPAGEDLETLGRLAYGQWKIGDAWDGGVLMVFPTSGRALFIQDIFHPAFTPTEVELLTALDQPSKPMSVRFAAVSDAVVTLLHSKIDLLAPAHRVRYVFGTLALLLSGIALTVSSRRSEEPGDERKESTVEEPGKAASEPSDAPALEPEQAPSDDAQPSPAADEALPGA